MKMRRRLRNKPGLAQAAFTLVEVLAALLVLGLALTALQLRMSQHLDSAAYLRDKTVASWVALNQLELLRIAQRRGGAAPLAGLQGSVTMAGSTWYWALAPQFAQTAAATETIVPVTIGVSAEDIESARTAPLVTLTGVSDAWR
jgi:general secretion pathway protein I